MKNKFLSKVSLALALCTPFAVSANDLVISTGTEGGGYEALGHSIVKQVKKQASKRKVDFDFEVINSTGSIENIENLNSGDAQVAIVQADALNVMKPSVPFKAKSAHTETVWWIYNVQNGFKDLEDIEGSKSVALVLIEGSGAVITMQSFANEDSGYKTNYDSAIYADDVYDAFDLVAEGKANGRKVAGLLYVGSQIPAEAAADFKGKVLVGEATDGDFDDAKDVNGDRLYQKCEVNKGKARGLVDSWGDPDTVCVKAMVAYSLDFEDSKAEKVVKKGITKALRGVK